MIMEMFVVLLGICGFLAWYGYYTKIRAFAVVGMSILFILSTWIVLYSYSGKNVSGLEYRTGTTINTTGSITTTTYNYTTYNDNTTIWVGALLGMVSAFGVILVSINDSFSRK